MTDWARWINSGRAVARAAIEASVTKPGRQVSSAAALTHRVPETRSREQGVHRVDATAHVVAVGDVAAAPDAAAVVTVAVQPQGGPSLTAPDAATATVTTSRKTDCPECRRGVHMPEGTYMCCCCGAPIDAYIKRVRELLNT